MSRLALVCADCGGEPLGVNVPGVYDGVLFWKCQDCGLAWTRTFTGHRQEIAQSYIDACNAGRDSLRISSLHDCRYVEEQLHATLADLAAAEATS